LLVQALMGITPWWLRRKPHPRRDGHRIASSRCHQIPWSVTHGLCRLRFTTFGEWLRMNGQVLVPYLPVDEPHVPAEVDWGFHLELFRELFCQSIRDWVFALSSEQAHVVVV